MPRRCVMARHCSTNYCEEENYVAIFFGLSGTGKTTLSADLARTLVSTDEYGVFNFEGSCYTKAIRLSREGEPGIHETTRRFGPLLEKMKGGKSLVTRFLRMIEYARVHPLIIMQATQALHDPGQSLWLANIMQYLLDHCTLQRFIDELSVTGMPSNPTIFDHALKDSTGYGAANCEEMAKGKTGEELFFNLALEDLIRAADRFPPVHDSSNGADGWVSLEVSPLLAHDTDRTIPPKRSFPRGRNGLTFLSRFSERKKVCRRSRRRFLQVPQSM